MKIFLSNNPNSLYKFKEPVVTSISSSENYYLASILQVLTANSVNIISTEYRNNFNPSSIVLEVPSNFFFLIYQIEVRRSVASLVLYDSNRKKINREVIYFPLDILSNDFFLTPHIV